MQYIRPIKPNTYMTQNIKPKQNAICLLPQGSSDCMLTKAPKFQSRLTKLVGCVRRDLYDRFGKWGHLAMVNKNVFFHQCLNTKIFFHTILFFFF